MVAVWSSWPQRKNPIQNECEPVNILFALRQDCQKNPGGDSIQMEAWRASLSQAGYQVTLSGDPDDGSVWKDCDLVFIWHLERVHESYPWWRRAKKENIPVVLVPTYWHAGRRFPGYSLLKQAELYIRRILSGRFFGRDLFCSWRRCRRRMLTESALLIANSAAEQDLLISEGAAAERTVVVPNVITEEHFTEDLPAWEDRTKIVCVGHFCPRKNQLGLIKALKGRPVRITFAGGARPMHKRYMERCIKASGGQHEFPGRLSHEETLAVIKESRYVISASLAETPGISNLEAAAAGCGLILPALAPVREYFSGCSVPYVDPCHIDPAIIERAIAVPPDPGLRENIRQKYTSACLPAHWKRLQLENLLPDAGA